MKKRSVCLVLAAVLTLTAAGCGSKGNSLPTDASLVTEEATISEETEAPVMETEAEEAPAETEAAAETPVQSGNGPELVALKKGYYEVSDDDNYVQLLTGSWMAPILSEESAAEYPALSAALEKEAEENRKTFDESVASMIQEATDWYKDSPDAFADGRHYTTEQTVLPERVDEKVTSYYYSFSDYTGGAHGMYGQDGRTFDSQTGEALTLPDVLSDLSTLPELIKEELLLSSPEPDLFEDLDSALQNYDVALTETAVDPASETGEKYPYKWVLTGSGIEFYFGPYELAAYAAGAQTALLTYEDHPDLFRPEYLPQKNTGFVAPFSYVLSDYDVNGDGEKDTLTVEYDYDESFEVVTGVYLTMGTESSEHFTDLSILAENGGESYYIVTPEGNKYVYLTMREENDYQELFVFDLTSGSPVKAGSEGFVRSILGYSDEDDTYTEILWTDPSRLLLTSRFDLLASFSANKYYAPGPDGMPVSEDPYYVIPAGVTPQPLTAKTDLMVTLVDQNGNSQGSGQIKAGESFVLFRTDGEKVLDVYLSDGSIGRLEITKADYPCEINGMVDTDCVVETWYAG